MEDIQGAGGLIGCPSTVRTVEALACPYGLLAKQVNVPASVLITPSITRVPVSVT